MNSHSRRKKVGPTISIVTPSFNQGPYIREALLSVASQQGHTVEHLVVDGGSTDSTLDILRECSQVSGWAHLRWTSEPDNGQSDALNKGFQKAKGELVGWLNSDDRYRPGCFDAVMAAAYKHPEVDVFYGDYTWIDERNKCMQIRREIEFSRFVLGYHRVLYIPTTSTFFRRRIFDEGNWINTQYHYAMDYEFFLRLAGADYRFQHIPHILADFRWHSESKTGSRSEKQLAEHDEIAGIYSPLFRRMPPGLPLNLVRKGARLLAGGRRYTEKLLRGYYFTQYRSAIRWPDLS